MASTVPSAKNIRLISRNHIGERIKDALHLYIGKGRRYSTRQVFEATGVPERSIEAAKCEPDDTEYRPLTLENLASLIKFLGAPFASAFLEPTGLGAFELMEGQQMPLPKVLAKAGAAEKPDDERRRLILRLAELERVV